MTDFETILRQAHAAAERAVANLPDQYACGWAWVRVDGNSPLARFCRAQYKARGGASDATIRHHFGTKGYPTGWQFWCPGNFRGQSVDAHEAGSRAFRDVLASYGIHADVCSRLD